MTYGFDKSHFIEHGPAILADELRSSHSTARNWNLLSRSERLALVESALRPANDQSDSLRLAV